MTMGFMQSDAKQEAGTTERFSGTILWSTYGWELRVQGDSRY